MGTILRRGGQKTGVRVVIGEQVCSDPRGEEDCQVAGAEKGLVIDSLNTPLTPGPMLIEDIFYLGTRSADDLAVFTGMSPELFGMWTAGG